VKAICFFIHFIQVFKNISYICLMQSAQKHTFINAKNLQGSKFFRPFKYFLAQHSTAQHSTAQHSTAQHSTAQHSTAQP
jgi:hypothetical protein